MANFVVTDSGSRGGNSFDTGIDSSTINAIPNLANYLNASYSEQGVATEVGMRQIVSNAAKTAVSDPVTFEKNLVKGYTRTLVASQNWRDIAPPPNQQELINNIKSSISYLASNKVPQSEISSLINSGVKEYQDFQTFVQQRIADINKPTGADKLAGVALPITVAYFLPSAGAEIASALNISASAGTAIASAAYQTSQGVDIETAIKNATVNAVTQTGSQDVAKEIAGSVGKVGADAIASAGGSIASTLAKGGSAQDAIKNAGASIAASLTSSETNRATGAAVGGAITGGALGAATGALGELGKPTPTDKGTQVASVGGLTQEPGVVSDAPTTDLGEITVTAPRDNVQVVSPTTAAPTTTPTTTPPATTDLGEITVTAPREKPQDVGEITVTAPKVKDDTQVISPDNTTKNATKAEEPPKETAKEPTYDPSLFVYSSKSPLSQALRLDMQAPSVTQTAAPGSEALSQALRVGDPGEPLFGGKKKGKKSGWNVESLRYMGQES